MKRTLVSGLVAALAMLGGCGPATSPPDNTAPAEPAIGNEARAAPAAAASSWANLHDAVGTYPRDTGLFRSSAISLDLKTLLGDKFDTFVANMAVQGPLAEEKGVLWTSGNKPHQGGVDAAYLLIDPATRHLEVGLWENGSLQTYASPGAPITKPTDVETMIANARRTP